MDTGFLVVIAVVACIAFAALVDTLLKQWRKSRKKEKEENISPEIEILAGAHPDSDASRKDEHEDPVQSEADCLEAERQDRVRSRLRTLDHADSAARKRNVLIAFELLRDGTDGPETADAAAQVRHNAALALWSETEGSRRRYRATDLVLFDVEFPFRLVDNDRDLSAIMQVLFWWDSSVEDVSKFVKERGVCRYLVDAWAKKTFESLPQDMKEQMAFVAECRQRFHPDILIEEVRGAIIILVLNKQFRDAVIFARRFGEESLVEQAEMGCYNYALTVGEYSFSIIHENKVTNRRVTPKNYPR